MEHSDAFENGKKEKREGGERFFFLFPSFPRSFFLSLITCACFFEIKIDFCMRRKSVEDGEGCVKDERNLKLWKESAAAAAAAAAAAPLFFPFFPSL